MTCPICKKPTKADFRPFCSKRCSDVDLGNWLNESYRIPVDPDEDTPDQNTEHNDDQIKH